MLEGEYLRRFEIHVCHKRQEKISDLTDLPNEQNLTLQFKLSKTLSQGGGGGKKENILLETVTMAHLIAKILFLPKLVKHRSLDFETVRMNL